MTLPLVFSAASLILCGFFFVYFRGYLTRRRDRAGGGEYRDEVEETRKLIADIDAATERDLSLIEDRLKILREVLDTADRRVAVLVRELDRTPPAARPSPLYTGLGKAAPFASPPVSAPSPLPEVPPSPPVPKAVPVDVPAAVPPAPAGPSIGKKAAELAEAGFSPELIAARLGVSVSEVDLAITVYRRGAV